VNSSNSGPHGASKCLKSGALRYIIAIFATVAGILAQSIPASVTTIRQPSPGHPVLDASGNTFYMSGPPTEGAAQTRPGGGTCLAQAGPRIVVVPCTDAAVIKVDPAGKQIWGSLLGGPGNDKGTALAIDTQGNVVLTGATDGQLPTTPGAVIESSTSAKVFAAKLTADGGKFLYSTYLPVSLASSSAIAVDAAGSAYIAGKTSSGHAFVLKLSPDGSTVNYNVTLAGSGAEAATALVVDLEGNVVVVGQTTSPDFPVTEGAFQRRLRGTSDNFLVRLDPSGNVLTSTYLGGGGSENPSSIAIDGSGNIVLAGSTSSLDFPTTQGVMQSSAVVPPWNSFAPAGFVAQFAPNGTSLNWASYVTSSEFVPVSANFDIGVSALAVGTAGDVYVGGLTGPGFPVTRSAPLICFQGSSNRTNGFLAHLNPQGALIDATYLGNSTGGDVEAVGGLLPLPAGGVLAAWTEGGAGAVSKVQFGGESWTPSACLSANVLNAATLTGTGGVAPGELITLTGFGVGPDIGVGYQPGQQGAVPTQLAGVQVLFDGAPVPILYAQSRQINAIAPARLSVSGTAQVSVIYNDRRFEPVAVKTTASAPGIFRLQPGQSSQAVAINQDGTVNGPANPAPKGSIVAVWGTGYGETIPACSIGGLNVPFAAPLSPNGGLLVTSLSGAKPAPVEYAGSAPSLLCGIQQINFQVPADATSGTFAFLLSIQIVNGDAANAYYPHASVTIEVK
jgi:uncharacterized protein (TIGR03437 family)